ncbi:hypothetical protein MVEN_00426800 [Mycena venus]|uniref:Rhodopsin domain-containing protein n=1 Tax=Mycena venus TaxID=2733690 RepID=A0A8H6YVF2_9AGAR|nr:hypothetical protein MVEN_00426800 [Mycena venus]
MINPNDPLVELKSTCAGFACCASFHQLYLVTSATCGFFALATTTYRLYIRYTRGRIWADDLWALFALVALIIQIIAVFLHLPVPNNLSRTSRIAAYYLLATTFYAIIWGSRLSILFSIIRLNPSSAGRKQLSYIALAFFAVVIFLLAQLLWVCEPEPKWKDTPNPQCHLPLQVAICQLVTDILADSILLIAPVPLFRSLSDKPLRRKLTLIFSTCVVSLVHAAFILRNGGIKVLISAVVEDCLSLIVANIPVVVTAFVSIAGDTDDDGSNWSASLRFNKWLSVLTHSTRTKSSLSTQEDGGTGTTAVILGTLGGGTEHRTFDDSNDDGKNKTNTQVSSVSWKHERDDTATATRKITFVDDISDAPHPP